MQSIDAMARDLERYYGLWFRVQKYAQAPLDTNISDANLVRAATDSHIWCPLSAKQSKHRTLKWLLNSKHRCFNSIFQWIYSILWIKCFWI